MASFFQDRSQWENLMKLMIVTATALALNATMATCSSSTRVEKSAKSDAAPQRDRYFDSAHGPDDPYSLWVAGDYIGRDPDPMIRGAMIRDR
jgi:hypothetical protein